MNMDFFEYRTIISYCWTKFNIMRTDLVMKQMFGNNESTTHKIDNNKVNKLRSEER